MGVFSVALLGKNGRVILARQFVEMPRARIESLLTVFSKLISVESQHTYIETDAVRYVYQALDSLTLVLVTSLHSNIVEDLSSLRLLARLVRDNCPAPLEERFVSEQALNLVLAFDEVLSASGHREDIPIEQINMILKAISTEEEFEDLKLQEKERNAYRLAQENAKRIEEMNQNSRKPRTGISSEDFRTTKPIISNQGMGSGAESEPKMSRFPSKNGVTPENTTGPSDRSSSSSNVPSSSKNEPAVSKISLNRENRKNPRANDKLLKQLINEGETILAPGDSSNSRGIDFPSSSASAPALGRDSTDSNPVSVLFEERLSCALELDGVVKSAEIRGEMTITTHDARFAALRVRIQKGRTQIPLKPSGFLNKQMFESDGVLCYKDPSKKFPIDSAFQLLRWNMSSNDLVPIEVECWTQEDSDGGFTMSVEYRFIGNSLGFSHLDRVQFHIPIFGNIKDVDNEGGSWSDESQFVQWVVDEISSSTNSSGNLLVSCSSRPQGNTEESIRLDVSLSSSSFTFAGLSVVDIQSAEDGTPVPFSAQQSLMTSSFTVGGV